MWIVLNVSLTVLHVMIAIIMDFVLEQIIVHALMDGKVMIVVNSIVILLKIAVEKENVLDL